ncbi:hypothetical protein [Intrasporangium sp.]|uniref:hypothetical protein n=1 Tax=Intrasporangium sp. TaxID=1925024 RepID=UPI0034641B00
MTETIVAIGTRKGLWTGRSDDRKTWHLEGPHFLMSEVASVAIDTRAGRSSVLAGVKSWHWGPTVQVSHDGGRTWTESAERAVAFPSDTDTALERVWQLTPAQTTSSGRASSRMRSSGARTGASTTSWSAACGTTPTVPTGSRVSVVGRSTPSSPSRDTPRTCSSR